MNKCLSAALLAMMLVGCSSQERAEVCEFITPAQIDTPTAEEIQRVEQLSGEAEDRAPEQRCN